MAGRPRTFDRTTAVDRFRDLFWQKGYAGTSIDDLQAAAGIQRGSFYAAFQDKESAYLEALTLYANEFAKQAEQALQSADGPRAGLAEFLRFAGRFLSAHTGMGCFLLSSIAQPPHLNETKTELFDRVTRTLRDPLEQACNDTRDAKQLRAHETANSLSAYILCQVLGLNALTRSGAKPAEIQSAANLAADLIF
ncbi:MAG: hypothetical protein COA47_06945 [Robiginitomaculum sp.]|nr:MAG: hypothetical protein COA47_06945 [Robiginitomaculum sp.]